MQQKLKWRIFFVAITFAISVWTLLPSFRFLGAEAAERARIEVEDPSTVDRSLQLGLDLQGGTHLVMQVDKSKLDENARLDAPQRALEIIRNRIDQYGVSEPEIRLASEDRIHVTLAGMNPERAKQLVASTAQLEFKLLLQAADVRNVLQRVEAAAARTALGDTVPTTTPVMDTAEGMLSAEADSIRRADSLARVVRSLFLADPAEDPDQAAADTNLIARDFSQRLFQSYLRPYGNGIVVTERDRRAVDTLLARPAVQAALRQSDAELLWGRNPITIAGVTYREMFVVKRRPEMRGDLVEDATAEFDQSGGMTAGQALVILDLKGRGPKEFARITGNNIGRQMAIVLDRAVYSAPVIQGRIAGGTAQITGIGELEEARGLAIILRAGALPAPMYIAEERSVGPTLGRENIQMGLLSGLGGLLLTFLIMVGFYRASGLLAIGAVLLNVVFLMAILAGFGATLTLPGIAGIVLTIGMAVDANVLIFERIREELRTGRSIRAAIDAGYKRAFSAIFDSNITTILTAWVLYYMGSGPIRGFGLTLMIGISVSMFTALFCTRLAYEIWATAKERKWISIGGGLPFMYGRNWPIVGAARKIGIASAIAGAVVLVLTLIPHGAAQKSGFNLAIDFTGGVVTTLQVGQDPGQIAIARAVADAGFEGVQVRSFSLDGGYSVALKTFELEGIRAQEVTDSIQAGIMGALSQFGGVEILSTETVGPTIGRELRWAALFAGLASLLVIMFYIWFRFGRHGLGYGVAALLTLLHDVILTLGLFAVADIEIDMTVVAAVLTMIGYSLNDTIVIFDRMRENAGKFRKGDFAVLANTSINETLSRTLMTSLATLAVTTVLWIFGGDTLRGFAITLTFGVIVGTYSSIAISSNIVIWWVRKIGRGITESPVTPPRAEARVGVG